jgi:hypothetical protein
MRVALTPSTVKLWLSGRETRAWANRPNDQWPCSTLAGHSVYAEFDAGGLIAIMIGGSASRDCDGNEFSAIVCDHLKGTLHDDHPAWFIVIGQFVHA